MCLISFFSYTVFFLWDTAIALPSIHIISYVDIDSTFTLKKKYFVRGFHGFPW